MCTLELSLSLSLSLPTFVFKLLYTTILCLHIIFLIIEHFTEIETLVLSHPAMEKELTDPKNGATALKHLQQQSSIMAHLDYLGILAHEDMYYIEFGAGRGKLSQCIQKAFQRSSCSTAKEANTTGTESEMENVPTSHELSNVHYVLVDRDSCRHKVDGFHRASALVGAYYHRLLMDIEHLDLRKLDCLNEGLNVKNVAAVSKHLCGAATDLSLRCVVQTFLQKADETSRERQISEAGPDCRMNSKLCGIVIALCCHHRCSWPQLVGRKFFEKLGFSPVDFHLVCHMSSWAVCGVRPPPKSSPGESKMQTEHADQIEPVDTTDDVEGMAECEKGEKEDKEKESVSQASQKENTGRTRRWGYVPHPNEEIGLQCKRLIDLARLSYLRENGLRAWLVYYVDRSTSLENVLLVALPTK